MECGLLLDVVVGQRAAVLQLLAGKNQTLLVGWALPSITFAMKRTIP
jgi:hypothetical protein